MHFLSSDNGQDKQPCSLGYAAGKAGKMIWASVGVGCSCVARPVAHLQFLYRFTPKSDPLESYFCSLYAAYCTEIHTSQLLLPNVLY